ncbi:MAG: hypothetical protein ACRDAG_01180 [Cetobacterium somerae]|uniref:hypothetical protein n=1 Tax=Cetobacterium somerae TaxID=188913 RepID=UPI003F39C22F
MEFLTEHKEAILVGIGFLIGIFLPLAKVHLVGKTIGQKIPKKIAIQIADYIDAFEHGLRNEEYQGDKNLISNQQLTDRTEKLKIDLGLEQKSKEKELK